MKHSEIEGKQNILTRKASGRESWEVEADPLGLLASFNSFFHDTMVVSPGRSSTVNSCRSPFLTNDEAFFSSFIGAEFIETDVSRIRVTYRRNTELKIGRKLSI
jgi:hypothetical protein